jgi:hypothetical protein
MARATIKTFEAVPLKSGKAFHGGFQPQSKVQKGYQPEGSSDVPQSVPTLVSGVVSPTATPLPTSPTKPSIPGR